MSSPLTSPIPRALRPRSRQRASIIGLAAVIAAAATISVGTGTSSAFAAIGDINTRAGAGNGDGRDATTVGLRGVYSTAVDAAGNVYISERLARRVRKVDAVTGLITTIAGTGEYNHTGDGGQAVAAALVAPAGLALFGSTLYIGDADEVRAVNLTTGVITRFAGGGSTGGPTYGDGGLATNGRLQDVSALAVDDLGDLYIADRSGNRIRMVDAATKFFSTVAGTGTAGSDGDGAAATLATIESPEGVAVDASHNVFVSDTANHRVRMVTNATGVISAFAGTGVGGGTGNGFAATAATLWSPDELLSVGSRLFIADSVTETVRVVSSGSINAYAGNGTQASTGDGGDATAASFFSPRSISADAAGDIFVGERFGARVRKLAAASLHTVSTIAGDGTAGYAGDSGQAANALVGSVTDVVTLSNGDIVMSDQENNVLRKVSAATGIITTFAGTIGVHGFAGDGGPAASAMLSSPSYLAVDGADDIFVADTQNARVRKIDKAGIITTVAGVGSFTHSGDNGPALGAGLPFIAGLALLPNGDLLIAENGTRLREVSKATGIITTIAGTGVNLSAGDNGPATAASFVYATGLAVDTVGNIDIVDTNAGKVRQIDGVTGIITTIAGAGAPLQSTGDGGQALAAHFTHPWDIALDGADNVFITDNSAHRIRRVDAVTHVITTMAGTVAGFVGDGGPATAARLLEPLGLTIDKLGDVVFSDSMNQRIRQVDAVAVPLVLPAPPDPQPDPQPIPDPIPGPTIDHSYHPVTPERLLDTRDRTGADVGKLGAGQTLTLQVTGAGVTNVPADASAVVLNVTVTEADGSGYLTVYPCGSARPLASNLNYVTGQTIPNLTITKLGVGGTICLYTQAAVHLIADIDGWYPAATELTSVTPERLLDTRDGTGAPIGQLGAGQTLTLQVTGAGTTNVPSTASAVVLNVTVTEAAASGYLTVYPCGSARPLASNLNYVTGQTIPNLTITKLGVGGTICLYTQSPVHIVADVTAWFIA